MQKLEKVLANNIRAKRLQMDLTQGEVAKKAGLNNACQISQYENLDRGLNTKNLVNICKALNTTPNEVLGFPVEKLGESMDGLTASQRRIVLQLIKVMRAESPTGPRK